MNLAETSYQKYYLSDMLLEFGAEQNNLLVDSSLKLTSSPAISPFGASQSPLIDTAIQQLELKLQQLATDPEFMDKMDQAFGNNWDIQKAQSLTQDWLTGEFKGIPEIKIVSQADINRANGAFADAIDTIYLSREFLAQNTANPEAVVDVLLEETGHFIDSVVNSTDTAGDEGERFAAVVQDKTLTPTELAAIQAEDDRATVVIDGQTLVIEKAANTVSLTTPDASAAEILSGQTANPGQFTITRTGITTSALTVNYTVAGTATKGTDYSNLTGSVTIPIGATTANIPITVIDDTSIEGSETAIVNLSTATTYDLGTAKTGTVTIADNDKPTVTVSTPDASAAEVLSGQTANPGQFTITRTGSTTSALTVNYTVAGTATKGTDYSNLTGSVTIPIGATTANIPITVIDDTSIEGSETAIVNLSTATTYDLGTAKTGTVTIADNEVAPINMGVNQTVSGSLSTTDPTNPTRTGGYYKDDYRLTGVIAGQPVKVNLNSSAFDAYVQIINESTGTVVTYNDDSNATHNSELTFIPDWGVNYPGVNYLVRVTSYSSGSTGAYSLSTISTPRTTVTLSASDSSATETLSGQTANPGQFTVTRTGSTTNALTVNYTVAGTATKGTDYSNLTGSVTIPIGATTANIPITVIDDSTVEGSETSVVSLSSSSAYTLGSTSSATVTITDNDPAKPVLTIEPTDASAAEVSSVVITVGDPNTNSGSTSNPGQFTIRRTGSTASPLTVNYSLEGTAINGKDYRTLTNSITIPAGASQVSLPINVISDNFVESTETVLARLSTNTTYDLGSTSTATVNIADDDQILSDQWKAEYFNNISLSGTPALVENLGSVGFDLGFSRNWGSNSPLSPTIQNDNFSAKITGQLSLPAGLYQMNTTSDDGVRVWVNNQLVIDKWMDQDATHSGQFNSTGGRFPVKIEYYEKTLGAKLSFNATPITPPTLTLTASDSSAAETISGQTANPGQFTITRTGSTSNALTVNYTVAGSASNSIDYSNLSGSLTIPAGSTTATLPVNVIDDSAVEASEAVSMYLSSSSAYTLGSTSSATVTIADNDVAPINMGVNQTVSGSLSTTDPDNPIRSGYYKDDYRLTGVTVGQPVKVNLDSSVFDTYVQIINESTGGMLTYNDDVYSGVHNSELTFTPQSGVNYLVRVTSYDYGETGSYSLTSTQPTNVTITASDANAEETATGQTSNPGQFTITRTGSTSNALTVNYTVTGSATNGTDYSNLTGSLTIPAGSTTATLPVNVIDDTSLEGSETAIVNLSTSTGYTVGMISSATVTIAGFSAAPGSLLHGSGPEVYIVEGTSRRHIPDPETLTYMGLNGVPIQHIGDGYLNDFGLATPLPSRKNGTLLRANNAPEVYIMESGWRRHIPDPDTFYSMGLDWNAIKESSGTDINNIPLGSPLPSLAGYYSGLASFSGTQWDQQSGDDNQFRSDSPYGGGDQRWKTDDRIRQIYTDLSTVIFGTPKVMNTGYAYDSGYYSSYGSHSGIDIKTEYRKPLYSATKGVVVRSNYYYNKDGSHNGRWIAVDELTGDGQRTGRRWWYGHLDPDTVVTTGQIVQPGQQIGVTGDLTGYKHHVHLSVINTYSQVTDWNEIANATTGNYNQDVQTILNRTMGPIQGYWKSKNGIKE